MSAPQHGTRSCYVRSGCRCEPCRAANRAYNESRRAAYRYGERAQVRYCAREGCGAKMVPTPAEGLAQFRARRYCSRSCASRVKARAQWDRANALPAAPLLDRIGPDVGTFCEQWSAYYGVPPTTALGRLTRMRRSGRVSLPWADEMALVLGLHIDLIYDHEEVAG